MAFDEVTVDIDFDVEQFRFFTAVSITETQNDFGQLTHFS